MSLYIFERKRSPFAESRTFAEMNKRAKKEKSTLEGFFDSRTEGFP